jgi:heme exporter protein A
MSAISVSDLGVRRGNAWLFRRLSFQLGAGRMAWIRGANGAGKTTLLRILAGLGRADEGAVKRSEASQLLYIGHANALKDDLTVTESLEFLAQLHGNEAGSQEIAQALKSLGIFHRRLAYVRTLSQGQRRRVALARLALAAPPSLWILDEPFDALDTDGIQIVGGLMHRHAQKGGSVAYTSHLEVGFPPDSYNQLHLGDN